jgi:hypothetical protein
LDANPLFRIFWLCLLFANPTDERLLLERYTLKVLVIRRKDILVFFVPNKWLNRSLKRKDYMLFLLKKGDHSLYD